jgi:hypothetical protein
MSAEVTQAIDVVARRAISAAAEPSFACEVEWGNYPEIGEYDWLAVAERVNEIRRSLDPPQESFDAAYALLESRVENG